jgi:hypothetical protein
MRYRVYASLLDKFQSLKDYEKVAEEPWNKKDDEYILTPDEMYSKLEVELINTINRCPKEPSEAADKGTAFNEVIDCLILNKPTDRTDMEIKSDKIGNISVIIVKFNGFTFTFETALCKVVAARYRNSLPQYLCTAPINTPYGEVELYGYIDEWCGAKMYDIKTTSSYTFGKYAKKWQKAVYPYCVIKSGMTTKVDTFEYTVVKLSKPSIHTPYITGLVYPEIYDYNHGKAIDELKEILTGFIAWLELRKDYITDKRIFGGENADGYVGTPITEI